MTARRFPFRLEIAGQVLVGEAAIEGELEELVGRDQVAEPVTPTPIAADEPRGPGRPSHASAITAAMRALGKRLDPRRSRAVRARQVAKYIAGTSIEGSAIPSVRTVEDFLGVHENSHGNSRHAKSKPRRK